MCRLDKNIIIKKWAFYSYDPQTKVLGRPSVALTIRHQEDSPTDCRPHAALERTEIQEGKKREDE